MDANLQQTIHLAMLGDQEAFSQLIDAYARLVFAQVVTIVKQREDAEDIVQETFLKAFRYRNMLTSPDKFPQWLLAIARNQARDHLRKHRRVVLMDEDEVDAVPNAQSARPGWSLQREDIRERLLQALDMLPERQRLAVKLKYIDGLDYQSIEEDMSISNGALRGLLDRAKKGLRSLLNPIRDERFR